MSTLVRYTRSNPCPVCGGYDGAERGRGVRCFGFLSSDGCFAHCTREEYAGGIAPDPNGESYPHFLGGECRCGARHGPAASPNGPARPRRDDLGPVEAQYLYRDAAGQPAFRVTRHDPKDFRPWHPNGHGCWSMGMGGVERLPYRLPEMLTADPTETVYVCEGEKDADALAALGLVATTSPGGSGQAREAWRGAFVGYFRGRRCIVLPDNDADGRKFARVAATALLGVAASIRVVELPALPEGGDVSDWLTAGGDAVRLGEMGRAAEPYSPAADEDPGTERPAGAAWPVLAPEALHGLAGEFVRTVGPQSEADPAALLLTFLVKFGNAAGTCAWCEVGPQRHYFRLNAVLVGSTSKARKGTSDAPVSALLARADDDWAKNRNASGLSSGEGLIWAVRDPVTGYEKVGKDHEAEYVEVTTDPGVTDKRLMVVEEEFASVLKVASREGNTLSPLIRQAWDSGTLRSLTKNSPAKATGAHISILGYVTAEELRRHLTETEAGNGFGNRFLWGCARRSKCLPEGGSVGADEMAELVAAVAEALDFARGTGVLRRDQAARGLWAEVYPDLSEGKPGLLGAMCSRAEAQVLRLSGLYALLDRSKEIGTDHLLAALAVWDYCEASARWIFGDFLGDPIADTVLSALRRQGEMPRTEINGLLGKNHPASRIENALRVLEANGLASRETRRHGDGPGRPAEVWRAVRQ